MRDVIYGWPLGSRDKLLDFRGLCLLNEGLKRERDKEGAVALVELGLELDPVQPEGVQEGGQALHQAEDADCKAGPERKYGPQNYSTIPRKGN